MLLKSYFCSILFILSGLAGYAQLCKGSLGDPVVTIDFGAGSARFGPPLPPGTTDYSYLGSFDGVTDGVYLITNNTVYLNPGWFVTGDHTGNAGGYMMLISASYQPGVFYTQRVDGLCPGTTYEFAAWVMNLLNFIAKRPNVTFRIEALDGTVLGQYNTGDIIETAGPAWKQYGLQFVTPPNQTSVIIKLINNGPGGLGNDVTLDDITFRACGPVLTSSINGAGTGLDFCAGTNATVKLSARDDGGFTNPLYQWQVNTGGGWKDIAGATKLNTEVSFVSAATGVYQYRLVAAEAASFASVQCRVASNSSTVTVHAIPVARASSNSPVCLGDSIKLNASGGDSYSWTGPNGFTSVKQSPVIAGAADNAGRYQVTVSTAGCQNTAGTDVVVSRPIVATASSDVTICSGMSTTLQAGGGTMYTWLPAAGLSNSHIASPVASPANTTTYTVQVSNGGCMQTKQVTVTVLQSPAASVRSDTTIMEGESVRLRGRASGTGISYYWTPAGNLDDAQSLNPLATPPADVTYTLHVVSPLCGDASAQVTIKVQPKITIPDTFSPNNDGINDVWRIDELSYYANALIQVFDRYGAKVYESRGYQSPWNGRYNGRDLPAGTYYYVIDLKNNQPRKSGWLLIIR